MTTALDVATYIKNEKFVYGSMHLQKLLYYSQAWALAWTGKPLFSDEVEAWSMGPVVRDVWVWDKYSPDAVRTVHLPDEVKQIVDAVYSFYGQNGGAALSEMTHQETPWLEARGNTPEGAHCSAPLAQSTMRRYFTKLSMGTADKPARPISSSAPQNDHVHAAGSTQRARWRTALDKLALV